MVSNFEGQSTIPSFTHQSDFSIISNFALQHLLAACLFAKNCKKIEGENEGKPFDNFFEDIRSYASGAIVSSVAGLEAYINELYTTHGSPIRQAVPDFEQSFYKNHKWRPTLQKYELALDFLEKDELDKVEKGELDKESAIFKNKDKLNKESQIFKNVEYLIELRKTLVHFTPFWDEKDDQKNYFLQKELEGKFETSNFINDTPNPIPNPEFAAKDCMTCSCSKWAVKTSYEFIDYFSSLANLENKLAQFSDKFHFLPVNPGLTAKGFAPQRTRFFGRCPSLRSFCAIARLCGVHESGSSVSALLRKVALFKQSFRSSGLGIPGLMKTVKNGLVFANPQEDSAKKEI